MNRNMKIDVFVDNIETKKRIVQEIRLYRAACRKTYSACAMAEMAGADIVIDNEQCDITVKPHGDNAKHILESAFQVTGKAHLYQLRKWIRELHPEWLSIVPESIHRDVVSPRWRAKDTEFPKATRGYLTLNGVRGMAQFNRTGIKCKNTVLKFRPRSFIVNWNADIGPVEFNIGKLDGSRWHKWKMMQSGEEGWKHGAIEINERVGKLYAIVSYAAPDKDERLNPAVTMLVEFGTSEENAIICSGDKRFSGEVVSVAGAIAWLKELDAIRASYLRRLGSYQKRRTPKQWRVAKEKLNRLAKRRQNGEQTHNHDWTRKIIRHAQRLNAGKITVVNVPEKEFFGQFWGWYQFKKQLKYKTKEIGGTVDFVTVKQEDKNA